MGDERRTAVRDLVALTDLIRLATVLEKGVVGRRENGEDVPA